MSNKRFLKNNSVMMYLYELGSHVVARSGIPSDMYHIGKLILHCMKEDPDFELQIDGALNKTETNRSVLERSVRCADAFRQLGLKCGDVVMLMSPNHHDVTIALYGAFFLGVIVAPVDMNLKVEELQLSISNNKPKVIFCQSDKVSDIKEALQKSNTNAKIVTFDEGGNQSFKQFLGSKHVSIDDFKVTDLDPENAIICLVSTSGSTGLPKSVGVTHKNVFFGLPNIFSRFDKFPEPCGLFLVISPLQWLSAMLHYIMGPLLKYKRLQTSATMDIEHIYDLINTYKPTASFMSPNFAFVLLNQNKSGRCDFSSFKDILIGGSAVFQSTLDIIKKFAPQAEVEILYGSSECTGLVTECDFAPPGSIGRPLGITRHRLVDVVTLEDIHEPCVTGELWIKGPNVFKCYYNDPEATKAVLNEDGWLRTGDLMYRDENYFYFFVDRLKTMLKYRGYQISPLEVEMVIRKHPGVADVAVVGIPDEESGDLVVACVVRQAGSDVRAQEIKNIVKENLSDSKHLRGGVVFMDMLPMGITTKCDRIKLKSMVVDMERQ